MPAVTRLSQTSDEGELACKSCRATQQLGRIPHRPTSQRCNHICMLQEQPSKAFLGNYLAAGIATGAAERARATQPTAMIARQNHPPMSYQKSEDACLRLLDKLGPAPNCQEHKGDSLLHHALTGLHVFLCKARLLKLHVLLQVLSSMQCSCPKGRVHICDGRQAHALALQLFLQLYVQLRCLCSHLNGLLVHFTGGVLHKANVTSTR